MLTYGTRGTGTESLTYRILQTPTYRTVPIIARLLDAAIIAGPKDDLDGLARRILNRIARYGDSAIPRTEFDLVSWADLAIEAPTVPESPHIDRRRAHLRLARAVGAVSWLVGRITSRAAPGVGRGPAAELSQIPKQAHRKSQITRHLRTHIS